MSDTTTAGGLPIASDALRRHAHHSLVVREVVEETPDTRTYVIDVPDELIELYTYEPGQFCTVRVEVDGDEVSRCYSMSSAPALGEPLAFTVKRVPGGTVSNWLHDTVAAGDSLDLMPPSGVFCMRRTDGPLIAFSGGSGVTPVFSIVKQVLATTDRTVRVFDANRDRDAIIFARGFDELAAQYGDRFVVVHHLDSNSGHPASSAVTDVVAKDTDAEFFICGPTPFMDLVESTLTDLGVPSDAISIERFLDATQTDVSASECELAGAGAESATTSLTIAIKRKRHTIEYVVGDTILLAARRAGLKPPSSCEQGDCATCMALVTAGAATMRTNNALSPDEVEEGWILTCQALPVGPDVTVEYDDF